MFDSASVRLSILTFILLGLCHSPEIALAQAGAPGTFVIEAEDFDYGRGQTKAAASTMPYLGGAYSGLSAVHNVDYFRNNNEPSADEYRAGESPNVPMTGNPDMDRGGWTVTANWRLGWVGDGNWHNYTRTFPTGLYKVYAALSFDGSEPDRCQGSLQRVTAGVGTTSQTLEQLGSFNGPATGGWGLNVLLPMKAPDNTAAIFQLDGKTTLRFTTRSGDFDYLKFVPAGPPQIAQQPADTTVVENRPATFMVRQAGDDPTSYQWQRGLADIPGATSSNYTFAPKLTDSGAKFRCILTNPLGTTNSTEATLTVTADTAKPTLAKALNLGPTTVRLTFDEGVAVPAGPAASSFAINNGVTVSAATGGTTNTDLLLTVSSLTYGTVYTVTVNNVTDLAATPNTILPDSTISFVASEYAPTDIGDPAQPGGVLRLAGGGFDVTAGGTDIGGAKDQFHFGWERRTGDFDIQARIATATITDPFLHAGLMARETLDVNARFGAVFASSAQLGCFFESRATVGAATTTAAPSGGFPVNYPQTWLRLRRTGSTLTGYASLDGQTWVQLGTKSITGLTSTLYFGLAVASENAAQTTTVQFRDVGPTMSTTTSTFTPTSEPLGPSSRTTGLIFSEIMYHPKDRADGKNLEFVEVYNARSIFEDLTGWRISGDIDFKFPDGFKLQAGEFVVIAAAPDDLKAVYGIANVLGPYTNSLPNDTGTIRLRNNADAVRLEVNYASDPPWPVAADGAGHSLVLVRPSYGENSPRAWAASELIGGSPGGLDTVFPIPQRNVVINEFLAHTDDPQLDFIKLYNRSNTEVDLSGCWLTDDPSTNKFRITDARIPARGFVSFDQNQLGFALSAAGETIYFLDSSAKRVLDAIKFGGQENSLSSGRSPDGAPTIRRLGFPTLAAANAPWHVEDVVINEVMFNPISGDSDDEYVELFNRGPGPVDLGGWKFTDGIDFKFPPDTLLAAGGYMVVAKNATRLLSNYAQLNTSNTVGDYAGTLSNAGEHLALAKPDQIVTTNELGDLLTNTIHIVVVEVAYEQGGRWGKWTDGGGSSLELTDPHADPLRAANWAGSDETQKGEWTTIEFTGRLDNGNTDPNYVPNRLHISMLGAGECLVDDVEIFKPGSTNLVTNAGFESGSTGWALNGNHSRSTVDSTGAFAGTRCLHVRGQGDGDTGINSVRTALIAGLASGNTATIRAKVRWLAGWPEVLFRTRGNWIELPARMNVPKSLGTPGLPNSRLVANAGPAIYDVTHTPGVPAASQAVVVTCRVSDPDGLSSVTLRYRVDPNAALSSTTMRDDGAAGDAIAGDGLYSATISGRAAGTVVAFRIEAADAAGPAVGKIFPPEVPAQECLIRWGDPVPFGTLAHYHLWNTQATENARGNALNNTFRDATLVYGNSRVIYNVGFRDKGSPYHGGGGDFTVTVPPDDLLLGATDRVFASTGNGGPEATGFRGNLSAWIAQQLGIPYLHGHFMLLYRNGGLFRNIMEDLEQPNNDFAEQWFPEGGEGDFYKVAIWFEFVDDNSGFGSIGATLEKFTTTGSAFKLARYRWNYQRRPNDGTANNLTNIFDLVNAANDASTNYVSRLLNLADIEEWMRVFAYHRVLGNWDSWGFGVGQNMFLFKQPGLRWKIMPWDIDFVLGLGNGPGDGLWGGQDPRLNVMFDTPAFRRMLWRAYRDAVNGPMLPENYGPQIEARRAVLVKNAITDLAAPHTINAYIDQRRNFLISQLNANDAALFAITSNGGRDFSSTRPTTTLAGTAPFTVATIEVNGIPYPVNWTDQRSFSITIPLTQPTNPLTLVGKDRLGNAVASATDTITVTYAGAIQQPQDFVALNEIQYDPAAANASFLELFNRSTTTLFDLSNFRVQGVGYTFAEGALIQPNSFLVLAKDRAAFTAAYGATIPVFDEFPGSLDNGGEHLALIKPGATAAEDLLISDVRYDNRLPWPTNAAGLGPSLQLIDAVQDEYRVGNWTATATNDVNRFTPGRANSVRQSLPAFPLVWLNEVLPNNVTSLTDNRGEREPWIELYNSSDTMVDLSPYYLTDDYTGLLKWQFPVGTTIGAKQYLIVWADGEAGESEPGLPHTSFRLDPSTGSLALVRAQGSPSAAAVMDYLDYALLSPDRSFGSFPDGEPRKRRPFHFVTPREANNPASPPTEVTINELMAGNTATVRDETDRNFDDWFELHNAGATAVDLTAYSLTDNLTNTTQFVIPPGYVIPPGGFLLVWADEDTGRNTGGGELHTNFRLALAGEDLGLFAPDGTLVDGFKFGQQTNDVSLGRFPDGSEPPLAFMESPSPGKPNVLAGGNKPPTLDPLGNKTVTEQTLLNFTATASDPDAGQTLSFSLSADAPAGATIDASSGQFTWTPAEAQGPASFSFVVRVTDSGKPARSVGERITVTVLEANRPPVLDAIDDLDVNEGSPLTFTANASDPDSPANVLTFSLDPGAPDGAAIDPANGAFTWTPAEAQGPGNYTITVRVSDSGAPPLSDTKTFRVTVNEVNNPPVLTMILPQTVEELSTLMITASAVDPDNAQTPILYSLDLAPVGAQIDRGSGVITWTPTEEQGPTNAIFIVRATEGAPPGLSIAQTFGVAVTEKNQPPTLAPLADLAAREGEIVTFTASASDPDLPLQALLFSLDPGAPAGTEIDPVSGLFTWAIGDDAGASANPITVRVTDNGPGNLSAARTFQLVVKARSHLVINEVMHHPKTANAEYVELFNTSLQTTHDLSGLALGSDNFNFAFPAGTMLAPRSYLCVARNLAAFNAAYGNGLPVLGPWTGALGTADTVDLFRPESAGQPYELLDTFTFTSAAPWPAAASGDGASLQLIDAARDNNRVANWSATASYNGPRQLIVMTNQWRYYQAGSLTSTNWRKAAFDDATWAQGRALLYVETAALPAPTSTALTLGKLTYYFRARFTIPSVPTDATLKIMSVLDDGMVVWLNGRDLFRLGVADGDATYDTLADRTVTDAVLEGPFTVPADALVPGENVVAVEVHQISATSSDIVFGLTLDLEGGNVPAFTPGAANNVVTSLPEFPTLRLNEVVTRNTSGLADRDGAREPWLELVNTGADTVSLDGLFLTDDYANLTKWAFPTGHSIAGGGFLVIFADGEANDPVAAELHTSFRLPRTGGANWSLALARTQNAQPAVLDYLNGTVGAENEAFGRTPDGDPSSALVLPRPTPGESNLSFSSNRAPVLGDLPDRRVIEGNLLSFTATASDPDAPPQRLSFELGNGAPADAFLDPARGAFSWTPPVGQAPSTAVIAIRVTDDGSPPLSDEKTFSVTVVPARLDLGEIRVALGGAPSFDWPAVPGVTYRVEFKESLNEPVWRKLADIVPTTTTGSFTDADLRGAARRFYRLVLVP